MAGHRIGGRRLSAARLAAVLGYCVMEARSAGDLLVGFVVVDLGSRAVASRHDEPGAARRSADHLISVAVGEERP